MDNKTDKIASTFLGKKVEGSELYNPNLLVAVPRLENRQRYKINSDSLPFFGTDIWHAYEFSTLTKQGIPITRLMKIKYSCDNDYIIESKSLKLYLNSFNMTKNGDNISECLEVCKKIIENDLSNKLQTNVQINFLEDNAQRVEIFEGFQNIMTLVDENSLKIDTFKEAPELLEIEQNNQTKEYYLHFDSLRSNCRVTHQPDFGDAFIYYKSKKHITESSLLKYLSSFRCEYHFHEECCEMIYKRLSDKLDKTDELLICALYTRRGGIDICPIRYSKNCQLKDTMKLTDLNTYARNGIRQ